jgi:hypothetical protein
MTFLIHRHINRVGVIVALLLSTVVFSQAAVIRGVEFADTVRIDQEALSLKGVAVLRWAMLFDVYAGAFYLPEGRLGGAWAEDLPKRLELSYFREIKADDFADTSIKLLRRNLPEPEYLALAGRLQAFCRLFQDVKPGDHYSLTYTPGNGTELSLNNRPLGSVPGNDFAAAYFGIWLGKNPIDGGFRDRLLSDP